MHFPSEPTATEISYGRAMVALVDLARVSGIDPSTTLAEALTAHRLRAQADLLAALHVEATFAAFEPSNLLDWLKLQLAAVEASLKTRTPARG